MSSSPLTLQEVHSKSKVCANVFCGAGRECAVNEKGEPSCLCIEVRTCKQLREFLLLLLLLLFKYVTFGSFFSFSRAASPTRGQCVAAMARPTGTTVSSTGTPVWRDWRSRWPTMDTARVRAAAASEEEHWIASVCSLRSCFPPQLVMKAHFCWFKWGFK